MQSKRRRDCRFQRVCANIVRRDSVPLVVSRRLLHVRLQPTTFGQKYCPLASSMNLLARLCISSDSNAPFFSHCERSHSVRQRPPRFICHRQRSRSVQRSRDFIAVAFAPLEKCRNSPPDCFFVAQCVASQLLRSHFWFESLLQKKKALQKQCFFFWRRRRDSNPRAGFPTYALSRGASSPT